MDFFEHQDQARRRTGLLVIYFALAVVLIILSVYAVAQGIFIYLMSKDGAGTMPPLFDPRLFAGTAFGVLLVILLGTLFKTAQLGGGGVRVAETLGGQLIDPQTIDLQERRLLNVVEEMALAAGMPVPPVYLMEEDAINAFAAGFTPESAVIGVTRGCIAHLNRDELQGVIGHEFSHILNGDMRLNIRLIGILHGILVIALIGEILMRSVGMGTRSSRGGREKGGGTVAIILFGLALFLIGWIGLFFGRLIKSAVSRQREFLADAASIQFTRNPPGLADALKKIGGLAAGSRLRTAGAEQASHLFFGNGVRSSLGGILSTHPPLGERILRIEPTFDGTFPPVVARAEEPEPPPQAAAAHPPLPFPMPGGAGGLPLPLPGGTQAAIPGIIQIPVLAALAADPGRVVDIVGAPIEAHLEAAQRILGAIPGPLREAVRSPFGAQTVVYGLLLDRNPTVRGSQMQVLEQAAGPGVCPELERMADSLGALPRGAALPLLDLAAPALTTLTENQFEGFRRVIDGLIAADEQIDLFEFAISKTLLRRLDAHFHPKPPPVAQIYSLRGLTDEISLVLSMLARAGAPDDPEAARRAFDAALPHVQEPRAEYRWLSADEAGLADLDRIGPRMRQASAQVRKKIVVAALQCLVGDGEITIAEAELFRAVAGALDCPVPPWVVAAPAGNDADPE